MKHYRLDCFETTKRSKLIISVLLRYRVSERSHEVSQSTAYTFEAEAEYFCAELHFEKTIKGIQPEYCFSLHKKGRATNKMIKSRCKYGDLSCLQDKAVKLL